MFSRAGLGIALMTLALVFVACSDDTVPPGGDSGVADKAVIKDVKPDKKKVVADKKVDPDTKVVPDTKVIPDLEIVPDKLGVPDLPPPNPDIAPPKPDLALPDIAPPKPDMAPPKPDLPPKPDVAPPKPDAGPGCKTFSGTLGKYCKKNADCGAGYTCLLTATTYGVCTVGCIVDNPATPLVNEDTCPGQPQNLCAKIPLSGGSSKSYCLRTCDAYIGCNECDKGIACHPSSGAYVGLYGQTVCLWGGCTANSDCPVSAGGTCNTKLNNCLPGESCQPLFEASISTDGQCSKPGKCDTTSGLCDAHKLGNAKAKVGAPCKSDVDCAGNMYCYPEWDENKHLKPAGQPCTSSAQCCSGKCSSSVCAPGKPCMTRNRNGYCAIPGCVAGKTLTIRACPAGSNCHKLYRGGICMKSCNLTQAASCRANPGDKLGDYECRDWSNLVLGKTQISKGPVCEFGPGMACDAFGSAAGLSCATVGMAKNPTNMTCRNLYNQILPNNKDPRGLCLDNTASGPAPSPPPDAGPPQDSGSVILDGGAGGTFGSFCNTTLKCNPGLICMSAKPGATNGYCTKQCPTGGAACTGAPAGLSAYCLFQGGPSTYYCLFVCKYQTSTWACPPSHTCNPAQSPPGSGLHICLP